MSLRKMVTWASLVVVVCALVLFVGVPQAQAGKDYSVSKDAAKYAADMGKGNCPKHKDPNCPKDKDPNCPKHKDPNCPKAKYPNCPKHKDKGKNK